jgi:hypothetical protein
VVEMRDGNAGWNLQTADDTAPKRIGALGHAPSGGLVAKCWDASQLPPAYL